MKALLLASTLFVVCLSVSAEDSSKSDTETKKLEAVKDNSDVETKSQKIKELKKKLAKLQKLKRELEKRKARSAFWGDERAQIYQAKLNLAFIKAVAENNLTNAKKLIDHGALVNGNILLSQSVLRIVLKNVHSEVMRAFVTEQIKAHKKIRKEISALVLASLSGHTKMVQLLLENGAKVNFGKEGGACPLAFAAAEGHVDIVFLLIKAGATIKTADLAERLVICSASSGNAKVLNLLMRAYPKLDSWKNSALIAAVQYGHAKVVKILLNKGAHVDYKDSEGATPLIIASRNNNFEIVKLLIKKGADVNARDTLGTTALMFAARNNNIEIANQLIVEGAHIDEKDDVGTGALMYAAYQNNSDVSQLLVNRGADINLQDNKGATPLIIAVQNNCKDVVKFLLNQPKIKVNNVFYGNTALIFAVNNCDSLLVKCLMDKGADPNIRNKEGFTALSIAKEKFSENLSSEKKQSLAEIIRVLEKAKAKR